MARSDKYWEQRALERLTLIERHSSEYMDQISKLYSDAKRQIYADIERILQKYIKDSGLGAKEARELLSTRESQDILDELRKRLSAVTDDSLRRQLLNRLNAPAYRARISRLQAIEASIDTTIKQIAPLETGILEQSLIDTADLAYYRTMFDTQRGLGINFGFDGLTEETVRSVMDEKWSGKHFSKRIWQNTDIVSAKLQEIVRQNVLTGRSWRRCMSDIEGFVDTRNAGAKFASERLLRTETNYVYNSINAKAYQSIGVEKYRYLATLDSRTSETCQAHDGNIDPDTKKEYTYENMKIGKNYPPLHAFCRSVTTARLDPELEARLTRTARDPATGKAYQVGYSMTYPQWKKSLQADENNKLKMNLQQFAEPAVHSVGKVKSYMLGKLKENLNTKEVVLTNERLKHILKQHPNLTKDAAVLRDSLNGMIKSPDYVLRDGANVNTANFVKYLEGAPYKASVRLSIGPEEKTSSNSILTLYKLNSRTLKQELQNEILYNAKL